MKQSFITFALVLLLVPSAGFAADAQPALPAGSASFRLSPNPKFLDCLQASANKPVTATVTVVPGKLNDKLTLKLKGVKPNLAFDLFTVETSSLLPDGSADPGFTNFGLAWYQSDVQANKAGVAKVTINTILLNQIFGFDPNVNLTPTNTFHVGIWFNDPNDAVPCNFDATKPTPFNGEHKAGPLAMITVPNATTNLGPLCTNPNTSTNPPSCNP